MEEDIKIIEQNIDYNSLIFGNGNAELSEKLRSAIEHLIQSYKEDEAVIEEMAKTWKQDDIRSVEEIKEYFRNKAKGEKDD